MIGFEKICLDQNPSLVVVGGDVNSSLACALVAAKLMIPVAHVESGLRSFDRSMPEEINRVLTDHMGTLLFTTEQSANENLQREGISSSRVYFVGNSMIDTLRSHLDKALEVAAWRQFSVEPGCYGLVTLHRPSNVDDPSALTEIAFALKEISSELPLLFPVHPRTRERILRFGLDWDHVRLIPPLGYFEFLGLMARARLVLTDSGGIQEETTALGVSCVTIRPNTERPITITIGTNRLAAAKRTEIADAARSALSQTGVRYALPQLWDGRTASRIVDVFEKWFGKLPEQSNSAWAG
jgi:UDP-N-acetylglucosamine 2-epimerase (non-hydrolysing)